MELLFDNLETLLNVSLAAPFVAGAVFGAVLTLFLAKWMSGHFGLAAYKELLEERKLEIAALKRENETLKQQLVKKDERIEALHKALEQERATHGDV